MSDIRACPLDQSTPSETNMSFSAALGMAGGWEIYQRQLTPLDQIDWVKSKTMWMDKPVLYQCMISNDQILVLAWRMPIFGCFNFRTSVFSTYIILLLIFRIRLFFTVASINSTEKRSFWSKFSSKGSIRCQGSWKYLPIKFGKSHLSLCLHLSMDRDCGSLWLTIE